MNCLSVYHKHGVSLNIVGLYRLSCNQIVNLGETEVVTAVKCYFFCVVLIEVD